MNQPTGAESVDLPVAVDAMGGDHAPEQIVAGALSATRERGIPVVLVGPTAQLRRLVERLGGVPSTFQYVDAPEVVSMEEHAVAAVRHKARASIPLALEEVKKARAGSMLSAGNSGAVVAAALFTLGRLPGVERPGIAIPFPSRSGRFVYVIDAGAFTDPRPNHLVSYAYLIAGFLRGLEGIDNPRIGLLSNGEEPGKGNHLTIETHQRLKTAPGLNFIGNVEANHIPDDIVDAVICDGFSGNVLLKAAEGAATLLQSTLRVELTRTLPRKLLALGLRSGFRQAARKLDYREYGAAPLLGVRGHVFIAHGRSDSRAIANAIWAAHRTSQSDTRAAIVQHEEPTSRPEQPEDTPVFGFRLDE